MQATGDFTAPGETDIHGAGLQLGFQCSGLQHCTPLLESGLVDVDIFAVREGVTLTPPLAIFM